MHHGPAFIGLGAPHAGLPQVVEWLAEHPAIADAIHAHNFFNTDHFDRHGYTWYEAKIAAAAATGKLVGDCSAGYLAHPTTAERIVRAYPQTKLFVLVRHPLWRALAAYEALQTSDQQAKLKSATEYLAAHPRLQTDSWYADALQHYFAYYSPLQLHIMVYEDLVSAPLSEMQRLYEFLGVDKNFVPKPLLRYAPPPDEPKHPSLVYRGRRGIKKLYRRFFPIETAPLFIDDTQYRTLQSEAERSIFLDSFKQKTVMLNDFLGRDMVAFWELDTVD